MGGFSFLLSGSSLAAVLYALLVLYPALPEAEKGTGSPSDQFITLLMFTMIPLVLAFLAILTGSITLVKLKKKTLHKFKKNILSVLAVLCGLATEGIAFYLVSNIY